ncbi:asparaginase [Solwaraspora sp. WMMD406]|uniref:asparaginase n=1 Tax=Solwaraspora sp. WMMD406 TaxID=3016095 RepID=UPI002416591D|nr:asparaginase [Solwaraspora sp. WMMD406]MDG4768222.1 asparaginase [Solwaraspora sp. WMMD406]
MTGAAVTDPLVRRPYAGGVPLVEVVRSGLREGIHHGSLVVLDASGAVRGSAGDVTAPVFPRSANKPMQAAGMLRGGLRLADPADLAVVCASHYGEEAHLARIAALLRAAGLTEAALRCPPDLPIGADAAAAVLRAGGGPTRLQMNCSGKHAGMLVTCRAAGWPLEEYWHPEHPLQERIRATVEEFAGEPAGAVGVDGCGAPVLALSLTGLARAFLRLVTGSAGSVERTVADAMRGYPELMSGTGAVDARLMRAVPGLLAKSGAEGVLAVAVADVGAIAVKIDDGGARGTVPPVVAALRRLGVTDDESAAPALAELAEPAVLGGGQPVGALRALPFG